LAFKLPPFLNELYPQFLFANELFSVVDKIVTLVMDRSSPNLEHKKASLNHTEEKIFLQFDPKYYMRMRDH